MAYPHTLKLIFPLEKYRVNSYQFKQDCTYKNVRLGIHLGEDINRPAGTKVKCIGRGKVVYSKLHPGTKEKGNWGNIIIISHKHPKTKKVFFSLYAHFQKPFVGKGQGVELGQIVGIIGKANTPENGWWKEEHLHFSIYTGPWEGKVLPGYWKKGSKRTKLVYWKEPARFINNYKINFMEIKIRKFRRDDSNICSGIIYECVAVAKKLNQKEKEFLRNFYFSGNIIKLSKESDFFVAENNGKVIGMGRLEKNKIATLYIKPEYQRKRIGTLIINYIIKKAQKKNIKKVYLEALLQSIGFYQKQGFKKIRILRKPIRCYKMEKRLRQIRCN